MPSKRLHLSLCVSNLDQSIAFYTSFFAAAPLLRGPAHAQWIMADPPLSFTIQRQDGLGGDVSRIGIQTLLQADELPGLSLDEPRGAAAGCGAQDDDGPISRRADPDGLVWESFATGGLMTSAQLDAGHSGPAARRRIG